MTMRLDRLGWDGCGDADPWEGWSETRGREAEKVTGDLWGDDWEQLWTDLGGEG